ncbi:type 1 glutamine amidotransferase [soil metagenome]
MRVGVIYHCEQTTGRLDASLDAASAETVRFYLHRGDQVPVHESFDRVVSLGGEMGAYEDDLHQWMGVEKAWLARLVNEDVPVLGVCLGSQLLADALGGAAYRSARAEADVIELELTHEGAADPLLNSVGKQVFSLHQDTFDLPPDATLLARSNLYPQAFLLGSAIAVQFHPDADLDLAKGWGKEDGSLLPAAGIDYDTYCQHLEEADAVLDSKSRAFFAEWLRA